MPPTPQVKRAIEKGNLEGARIYAQNAIRKKNEQLNYLKVCAQQAEGKCRCACLGVPHSCTAGATRLPGRVTPRARRRLALLGRWWGDPHTLRLCGPDSFPAARPSPSPRHPTPQLGSRLDAVVSRLETQAKMNVINKSFAGIVHSLERALNSNNLQQVSHTMDQFERQFENLDVQSECVEAAMSSSMALSTPQDQVDSLMQQVADEHNLTLTLDMPAASKAQVAAPQQALPASPGDDLSRRLAELKAR